MRLSRQSAAICLLALTSIVARSAIAESNLLVDASKDGGMWWYPQGKEGFDPERPHQGKRVSDHMRTLGWRVEELARGETVTVERLAGFDVVLRPPPHFPYSPAEVRAYSNAVSQGARLALLCGPSRRPDAVAQMLGLRLGPSRHAGTPTWHIEHSILRNAVSGAGPWALIEEMPADWVPLASVTSGDRAVRHAAAYGRRGDGHVLCLGASHMQMDPSVLAEALQSLARAPSSPMSELRDAKSVSDLPAGPSAPRLVSPETITLIIGVAIAAALALWIVKQSRQKHNDEIAAATGKADAEAEQAEPEPKPKRKEKRGRGREPKPGTKKPGLLSCVLFFILWCIIGAFGRTFCMVLLDLLPPAWETFPLVAGGVTGLCLGVLQWLLLRRALNRAWLWIVASVVGWTLGQLLWQGAFWATRALIGNPMSTTMFGLYQLRPYLQWATIGAAVGVSQWFYLRTRRRRSLLWVPTAMVAHTIYGCWISSAGMFALFAVPFAGATAGAVGAATMLWILRGGESGRAGTQTEAEDGKPKGRKDKRRIWIWVGCLLLALVFLAAVCWIWYVVQLGRGFGPR